MRAGYTVTAQRDGRSHAALDIISGASNVTITTASLGRQLIRASTPAASGIRPRLAAGRQARLSLVGTGRPGPASVRVVLASGVRWQLTFRGGSSQTTVDLGGGQLSGADFIAGSSVIAMLLPRPQGTITLVLAGGASRVSLSLPVGIPARLRLGGGAASATLGGRAYSGIAGGTVLTMPGWSTAASRYDIDAPAGVAVISVTSR